MSDVRAENIVLPLGFRQSRQLLFPQGPIIRSK